VKGRLLFSILFLFLVAPGPWLSPVRGQEEYHGADSSFQLGDLVILWGILKGPDEDRSWVYIKIIRTGSEPGPWTSYRLGAVDPFSQEREWVTPRENLRKENAVKEIRSSFREKTGRRLYFYPGQGMEEKPAAIIFYQGVPDTTPEFLTEKEMEDYFGQALKRMKKQ
jgi:hypothetical protein